VAKSRKKEIGKIIFNPMVERIKPRISKSCYIAPSAIVIGDVVLEKDCSVFPNAVIRGDENSIRIGEGSNIQDCCVVHTNRDHTVTIGKYVTLGHGAIVHGARVEDYCIIGMHATILNGARIGRGSIVGANALITENSIIPENSLVMGVPGRVVKTDERFKEIARKNAEEYLDTARRYKGGWY
jgi:carbonic anhydrase/acetyltransferase-like protein (isoleucine patch superfamily)